jgi:hypothetical protein
MPTTRHPVPRYQDLPHRGLARGVLVLTLLLGGAAGPVQLVAQDTHTIFFDGTGAEEGITEMGATDFTVFGSTWTGGTAMTVGIPSLYASGIAAYHLSGQGSVTFAEFVDSATVFFVHSAGEGPFTATARDVDGLSLGEVSSRQATSFGDPANFVTLDPASDIARIEFSGGHLDNFTFTTTGVPVPSGDVFVVPGDRVAATLTPGEPQTVFVDLPAGARLTLRAKRSKGSAAMPGLRLLDPDLKELVSAADSALSDSAARIAMEVATTGTYTVELVDRGQAGGTVRLKSKAKYAKLPKEVVAVSPVPVPPGKTTDDNLVTVHAVRNTVLRKLLVKRLAPKGEFAEIGGQPSDLSPGIASVAEQGGGMDLDLEGLVIANAKGTRVTLKVLVFETTGVFEVLVEGLEGSVGFGRASVKLRHPRGKQQHVLP